jgi:hypothetical protein
MPRILETQGKILCHLFPDAINCLRSHGRITVNNELQRTGKENMDGRGAPLTYVTRTQNGKNLSEERWLSLETFCFFLFLWWCEPMALRP